MRLTTDPLHNPFHCSLPQVLFLGISYEPPAIISEYCARGSLFDVLRAAGSSEATAASLTWPRRLCMALDAAKGMLALHSHQPPIIHR